MGKDDLENLELLLNELKSKINNYDDDKTIIRSVITNLTIDAALHKISLYQNGSISQEYFNTLIEIRERK